MNSKLTDTEKAIEEYKLLLESRTVALAEKGRMLQERDERCEKLKLELLELKKEIQVLIQKSLFFLFCAILLNYDTTC